MGIFGGSSSPSTDASSKEVKEALFKQVQAESAMSNARTLITVCYFILFQEFRSRLR
jgi:import inner membrane translocase subunit TIM13